MYHNFCVHSSGDGHLGRFCVPAAINSAAVNTGARPSVLVFSGVCPAGTTASVSVRLVRDLPGVS